ncbi:bifunctional metallophosphatase/5'-nucleotidase [Methanocorpusculum vombati]|uniref:5'-nucleotidase C-terminal domain-containing protein n=1 Tax=Methanocorpusculum vombati TaxID=3002864 RepID=A0ABT4IKN7_9EURY|nr:5'-nucleotidase C-terminal domain-containing protein [Methanocorpusculum vombati]MCZ0862313.1 5'-nucleotidase C-terminal domain-containing protein [Methanocorpusculum vombati]MDE2519841.1 5'-nucleotidase C-terminal domain-containing protein [Methanocorpusculum sp.]MDE2535227.1 5'-nucleotidase C-terminal domain-containing protein [Methanocorpusculum sp.]MDE2545851.1 5'-nucleotidase C-terminal domain-containing protein [Methanocorpusculum sp.]
MNPKNRIYLAVVSAAVILLAVVLAISMGTAGNEEVTITIYHTNDMHGHLADLAYTIPLRSATPNSLLVSAGDDTQGTLLTTATNGTAVMTLMNAADYDLMTLGNHEFDKGAGHAAELAGLAEFPVLSANTIYPNGTALLGSDGNLIIETGGKRIGFFGITTTETSGPYAEFLCTDEIRAAKNQTIRLAEKDADLIVALVHIGNDPSSSPTSYDLAAAVPEIDLIIDGHSHTVIQDRVGNTTIVQTGAFFQNLGRINITFTADGPSIEPSLIPAAVLRNGTADPAYAALYANLSDLSGAGYERVIGNSATPLAANGEDGTRLVRMQEMPLGDLVADSMRWYAETTLAGTEREGLPVVAAVNGGGVRENLPAGDLTLGDAYTVLPFGNMVTLLCISPSELYAALENGVSCLPGANGRFLQVAGMRVTIDAKAVPQSRVVSVELAESGRVLDRNDTTTELVFATNSFVASGAEGYAMFAGKHPIEETTVDAVVFAEYLTVLTKQGGGSFTYAVPARILG